MYIVGSLLSEIVNNLVVDIYLIFVFRSLEEWVFQVFFQSHFVTDVGYAQIQMTTFGIEEGADFLHNLHCLCRNIHSHGVLWIYDRGLELCMEVFLAIVLFVGRRFL